MMSNDLSRQLCELCGIEPKCVNCGQTVSDENPCPKPCDRQKFPDFTKPVNFVRLLKIWLAIFGEFRLERYSMSMEPEEKLIIDCLIRTSDDFYPVNKLKQPIGEAEWVYD